MSDNIPPFSPQRFCHLPPAGGRIGSLPEHFVVEEVPAYPLSGQGEHVFLWIEKRNSNTTDVAACIARAAKVKAREVGYAGMKDKVAITRQWFSVSSKDPNASAWDLGPDAKILAATRHGNKLRTGHLIANRFAITLVDLPDVVDSPSESTTPGGAFERAQAISEFLSSRGLPNYFGPQRFGHGGRNLKSAFLWLEQQGNEGSVAERDAGRESRGNRRRRGKTSRFDNKMLPSVLQSEIFNRYLTARLSREEELLEGEVVRLDGAGKCFVVETVADEIERLRSGDIHLTGPMIGSKTLPAQAAALQLERSVIDSLGMSSPQLTTLLSVAPGTRRDLFLSPGELLIEKGSADSLTICFTLPAGAYATQLVREFTGASWETPREVAPSLT